ncbi:unnamed protein product [Chilo suppressalis]|uniref:N-acetyltransferase domain-containing protein n=1 Tax=Chilo suppressalis TaxID=168631 RepID=A0ABN8B5C0_CHISP|nr:unnamed protein product [Chilo suppressalis]
MSMSDVDHLSSGFNQKGEVVKGRYSNQESKQLRSSSGGNQRIPSHWFWGDQIARNSVLLHRRPNVGGLSGLLTSLSQGQYRGHGGHACYSVLGDKEVMAKSAEAEVEKMKLLEERIKAPSIWGRLPCGLRFEDLQDRRYEDAVRFLKKHFLQEESRLLSLPRLSRCALRLMERLHLVVSSNTSVNGIRITYRSVKLVEDTEGADEFVHNVRIWMKDKMSIAAVKEGTDKLVGVLIMRIQEKNAFTRTFSRVKLTHNPLYTTIMKFYNEVENPVDIFEKLGVRKYFKVYILALKQRYRHRGIAKEMLKAAIPLAASANVPAIAGIFTTARSQQIAEEIDFEKLHEIYYIRYLIDEQIGSAKFLLDALDRLQRRAIRIIGNQAVTKHLEPLQLRRDVVSLSAFYRLYHGEVRMAGVAGRSAVSAIFASGLHLHLTSGEVESFVGPIYKKKNKNLRKYKVVFWDTGLGNYSAALMAYRIPEIEEAVEIKQHGSSRFNVQPLDDEEKIPE